MAEEAAPAFFSYCRDDSDFALRLAADLKAVGASVWLDQLDIVPGQRWDRAVEDALARCPRMLVILSPASVDSTNVMDEVSFALEEKKIVIPLVYKDCTLPFRLRRVQYVDFRQDYQRGLRELVKTLAPAPMPSVVSGRSAEVRADDADEPASVEKFQTAVEASFSEADREQAAEKTRREEASREAAERARQEEQSKLAAEQERSEQEKKRAATQAQLGEKNQKAAEQKRLEEERQRAAERTRLEQERKQAEERARQQERRTAEEEARRERERKLVAEQERQDHERRQKAAAEARVKEGLETGVAEEAVTALDVSPTPLPNRWRRVAGVLLMNLALGSLWVWCYWADPRAVGAAIVTSALAFVIGGRWQDKRGPFRIALTGGILFSLGFMFCAVFDGPNSRFVFLGMVAGLGNGLAYATSMPVMAKWFPDKRGLAVGLAVAGYGLGSVIFGPRGPLHVAGYVPTNFLILGVIFLLMTGVGAFLLRNPPEGYQPPGWTPAPDWKTAPSRDEFTPRQVLRTRTFYFMWLALALGCGATVMMMALLVPFAESAGIAVAAIASMHMVAGSAGDLFGRIVSGWMSDAFGRLKMLRLALTVAVLAAPMVNAVRDSTGPLYLMLFVVFWCYGTLLSVNASAAADFWGSQNAGANYGMLSTAWAIAGIIGPMISALTGGYGNYSTLLYWAAGMALVALLCELAARRPTSPDDTPETAGR